MRFIKTLMYLDQLQNSLSDYRKDYGDFPVNGLEALLNPPDKYIDRLPRDGWGNAYIYRHKKGSAGYTLYSIGKNQIDESGEGDDIVYGLSAKNQCSRYQVQCSRYMTQAALLFLGLACILSLIGFLLFGGMAVYRKIRSPPSD